MNLDRTLLDDAARFPLLTDEGRRFIAWMWELPGAPHYAAIAGDRLDEAALARVRAFEAALRASREEVEGRPPWLDGFVARCLRDVPFYRRRAGKKASLPPPPLEEIPACAATDLAREPWAFVPDGACLDEVVVARTAGTTGPPLVFASHPEAFAATVPLLRLALGLRGVALEGGAGRVALVQVRFQRKRALTGATVAAVLGGAGFAKVNLHPGDWDDAADRAPYLDRLAPEVYTGSPIALDELARLQLATRPKALVSTSHTLLAALRTRLEARFACPVIDLYGLTETGPLAASPAASAPFTVLPNDVQVEVLDPYGRPCGPGERGEIAVTGGRNPFLPLLRYRTGDFASLDPGAGAGPSLAGLESRRPVLFRAGSAGRSLVHSLEVTDTLAPFALAAFRLHQEGDGALLLEVPGPADSRSDDDLARALRGVFGEPAAVRVVRLAPEAAATDDAKPIRYTSAVR